MIYIETHNKLQILQKGGNTMEKAKRHVNNKSIVGFMISAVMVVALIGLDGTLGPAAAFKHGRSYKAADIQCGDTIGPGERVKLTQDIGPCEGGPAITVVGPAVLNLNGYTVAGDGDIDGIVLEGKKATVMNGTVIGCYNAVVVMGKGRHKIKRINAEDNIDQAFVVYSDNNKFLWNKADMNGDDGFYVEGNGNRFILNKIYDNDDEGLEIEGDNNRIVANRARGNNSDSFEIGGDENRLVFNKATDGRREGFEIEGIGNVLKNNRAKNNGGTGFRLEGSQTLLKSNRAINNDRSGILVDDDAFDNTIKRNRVKGSGESGILVENAAYGNVITKNVVKGNGLKNAEAKSQQEAEFFDMEDEDNGAEANTWYKNRFETSNQDYIN
jgi:parallel beta-helix repeat protein